MESDPQLLTLKKHQRTANRTNASKESVKCTSLVEVAPARMDRAAIETSVGKLQRYRDTLAELDNYIQYFSANAAEMEADIAKSMEVSDGLTEIICKATSVLSVADVKPPAPISNDTPTPAGQRLPNVKLPKLELAPFEGDPMRWEEFWDGFKSTIHENTELSDIDKFKYLRNFLKKEALDVVGGYMLTSANYAEAISALRQRFGDPEAVIFAHFDALLSLPVANSHDVSQLQRTFDRCEAHIRSLTALGLEESTFGRVFTPIIISKLPKFVRMDLYRQNSGKPWKLSVLRELLAAELRVRQMSMQSMGNGSEKTSSEKKNTASNQRTKSNHATTTALVNDSAKSQKCDFCGGSHYSDMCRKFADVDSRQKQIHGKCYSCLGSGHNVKECSNQKPCHYCKKLGHHRSLCYAKFPSKRRTGNSKVPRNKESGESSLNVDAPSFQPVHETLSHGESTYLSTGLVDVRGVNAGTKIKSRCFLDSGGSRTFVVADLCRKLQAKVVGEEMLSVAGFRDAKRKEGKFPTVQLELCFADNTRMTIYANVVDHITCPVQILPIDVEKFSFVRSMQLAEPLISSPKLVPIDILIGNDYYYDIVGSSHVNLNGGPKLISSRMGYIVAGRVNSDSIVSGGEASMMLLNGIPGQTSETFDVERFWTLEDIGIRDNYDSPDDELALKAFNETVRYVDGRYEVVWPWKDPEPDLPDNYQLAKGRLKSLIRRIGSNESVLKQYNDTIADQLSKGIIEEAPAVPNGKLVHYIPHHCVLTPGKATTKLRVVYDASAKCNRNSSSLNEALFRGPVMLSDLCGLLIRFRMHRIGIVSDIEKAFLQVGLQVPERDVTRFLWLRDVNKPPVADNIVIYRFTRVPFGYVSSTFLLGATVCHHLGQSNKPVAKQIADNLYVDNVVDGQPTPESALAYYSEAKQLFNEASMNLREWYSNSAELMSKIEESDRGKCEVPKVLGLHWKLDADSLSCGVGEITASDVQTKRQILQAIAKIFDPCGFFAPVTIVGKILMQKLWLKKVEWDSVIDADVLKQWMDFYESFRRIPECPVSRLAMDVDGEVVSTQLHCFCDASSKAFAAVVYLRSETVSGVSVKLLFAKSRVCPVKPTTIPRLELMAVTVGTRLLKFVEAEMRMGTMKKFVWSDSKCVLAWIQSTKVSTVFVRNRVKQIKSVDAEFRYVETAINPADLPSRGVDFETTQSSKLWWCGPAFLKEDVDSWPSDVDQLTKHYVDDGETSCLTQDAIATTRKPYCEPIFAIEKCSTMSRVLRVTAWIKRFVHNCRKRHNKRIGSLSALELNDSLDYWIKYHQSRHFGAMLRSPEKDQDKRLKRLKRQLSLEIDEKGFIRSRGRFEHADVALSAQNPILLAANDELTHLIIKQTHQRLLHAGVSQTLAGVRQTYWVIKGRQQVKKVLNACQWCRRINGGPFLVPSFPSLPSFRVNQSRPFEYTGIDYLGPLYVRGVDGQIKVWLCLFTCATIRAVHLEMVDDLSCEQFLLSLRRFVALYSRPSMIISDNGSQFKAADKFLKKMVAGSTAVKDYLSGEGITWKFIPEMSPWMGGFYERMVGCVKSSLKKSLWNRCVTAGELKTVISEVAAVVNSRPLTYQDSDSTEVALTPAHFLSGGSKGVLPAPSSDEAEYLPSAAQSSHRLVQLWKRLEKIMESFWSVWRNQYLLSLRGASPSIKQRNVCDTVPRVGAVVLIKDQLPRCRWKIGRICELNVSNDNLCRSVQLRLPTGKVVTRPIKLLYPLEIGCASDDPGDESLDEVVEKQLPEHRPTRSAKLAAKIKISETVSKEQYSSSDSDN